MPTSDPSSKARLRGRIGALSIHARYDSKALTAKARERFLERFLDEVDPKRELPEKERLRRAASARRAYFARLALRSANARARRARHRATG
ncbi:MAG: hypothetical protein M3N24_01840 [Actinomycetota bacterium]|nr:hypothetical protein [Actinomycetota bacterium]